MARTDRTPADALVIERLELACSIAQCAGELTLTYFRQDGLHVDRKSDDSPVTIADREAELLLRRRIEEMFPDDAILGEEFPARPGTSGFRWILDPIDGTKSFITGVPLYATLIGIDRDGAPTAGVIHVPPLEESLWGAIGHGAWHALGGGEPRRARVSNRTLAEGTFLTSELRGFRETNRMPACERLEAAARLTRTWGDAYGYLLVATGRAEAMVDPVMNVWDAAALLPILEEAGGTFTDWQGRRTIEAGEGIGTNGRVLNDVLRLIRD
jgi:histidinol-phosphatase